MMLLSNWSINPFFHNARQTVVQMVGNNPASVSVLVQQIELLPAALEGY
jgi:hypothetical protein